MTGWQVQAMKEAEDARIWEELNAPDPYEEQMKKAAVEMKVSAELLDRATNYLMGAVSELEETPMQDVLASLLDEIEERRILIKRMAENYERGVRE